MLQLTLILQPQNISRASIKQKLIIINQLLNNCTG